MFLPLAGIALHIDTPNHKSNTRMGFEIRFCMRIRMGLAFAISANSIGGAVSWCFTNTEYTDHGDEIEWFSLSSIG